MPKNNFENQSISLLAFQLTVYA